MGNKFNKEFKPAPNQKALHDSPDRVAALCDLQYVITQDHIDVELTTSDVETLAVRHQGILKDLSNFNFNIFEAANTIGRDKYMPVIAWELMKINKVDRQIKHNEFIQFSKQVYNRYQRTVQYHNDLHGTDVAQHINFMLNSQGVDQICKFTSFDRMAIIVSALCHDLQHNGFTNGYHKNNKSNLQRKFGDFHIQEYFHAS